MKKLIYRILKEKVDSGEIQLGFNKRIVDFTLESVYEKIDSEIVCTILYIEDGNSYTKTYNLLT